MVSTVAGTLASRGEHQDQLRIRVIDEGRQSSRRQNIYILKVNREILGQ